MGEALGEVSINDLPGRTGKQLLQRHSVPNKITIIILVVFSLPLQCCKRCLLLSFAFFAGGGFDYSLSAFALHFNTVLLSSILSYPTTTTITTAHHVIPRPSLLVDPYRDPSDQHRGCDHNRQLGMHLHTYPTWPSGRESSLTH